MVIIDNPVIIYDDKTNRIRLKQTIGLRCVTCQTVFIVIGSRDRTFIDETGKKQILALRRLRCPKCNKIHHELPSFLVPYKLHLAETYERCATSDEPVDHLCGHSAVSRIKRWFRWLCDRVPSLIAMRQARYPLPGDSPPRPLEELSRKPGWLSRIVHDLANHGLWPHTRRGLPPLAA